MKTLAYIIFSWVAVYLMFAFVLLVPSPLDWSAGERLMYLYMGLIATVGCGGLGRLK